MIAIKAFCEKMIAITDGQSSSCLNGIVHLRIVTHSLIVIVKVSVLVVGTFEYFSMNDFIKNNNIRTYMCMSE